MSLMRGSSFQVVSTEEWVNARKALLAKEKELTKAADHLRAERRKLPVREVTKEYTFKCPKGDNVTLSDLFQGRKQLIVYHFMFGPDDEEGCVGCSMVADHIPNHLVHLNSMDTSFIVISRAPIEKIEAFKKRMGWTFPWVSSFGSDFNYDFHVTLDESVAPVMYNYRNKAELEELGLGYSVKGEQPGSSAFFKDGDRIYHTYSTYGRGTETLVSTYAWLDSTLLGRQPDGPGGVFPWKHHDRY
jgi:predicted dithiol-disulfide oxidoreductase (DUF899 family)